MKRSAKTNSVTVTNILRAVHEIAPPHLAEAWDNVGLQIGDPEARVKKILVGLEVTRELLDEATAVKADLLVTHHPLIFQPLKNLAEDKGTNQLVCETIRRGLSLIAAHTNLDSIANGTNGELADRIGLQTAGRRILRPAKPNTDFVKYAVFVPKSHVEKLIEAMSAAGAGEFGNYSHCTFGALGTGTFKPLAGASPYSGEIGKVNFEEEVRLETRCAKSVLPRLMAAVRAVHPYEVIAFDVYTLEPTVDASTGLGMIGNLPEPMRIDALIKRIKKSLQISSVGVVGDTKRKVQSVALSTGASGMFVREWRADTADIFITGEMTHHDCAEAHQLGLPVLLVGHWDSEAIVSPRFASMIRMHLQDHELGGVEVVVSRRERNPLVRL